MSGRAPAPTDAPERPALEARSLTKRVWDGASRRTVVDGVSLTVARGELVLLLGPSGSGKTTLLALLGAMLSPTSGEVLLDGEPTSRLRERHRADVRRSKVGFLFQGDHLLPGMSVRENVLLPCAPNGISEGDERRADALLRRFELEKLAGTKSEVLAGGERQRVALARALMLDPPIVLLDEPTAHLDEARTRVAIDLLRGLTGEGRALLVATHDPRLAQAEGVSRVLTLADGRIVPHGHA